MEEEKLVDINGWIFIDKPSGISSFRALNDIKKCLVKKTKVGHGGTLDPMAEGVLPVAIGEATKTLDYVLNADKVYVFTMQLGKETTTGDKEGAISARSDYISTKEELEKVIPSFLGKISQTPPKYSAIKIDGKRAYDLVRNGIEFTIKSREITIHSLKLLDYNQKDKQVTFEAKVSKGTYIRTLAEDIAKKAGSLSYLVFLRRSKICINKEIVLISLNTSYNLKKVLLNNLISIEDMLDGILAYPINKEEAKALLNGNLRVFNNKSFSLGKIKALYNGKIIALLEKTESNLKILRVFNNQKKQLT